MIWRWIARGDAVDSLAKSMAVFLTGLVAISAVITLLGKWTEDSNIFDSGDGYRGGAHTASPVDGQLVGGGDAGSDAVRDCALDRRETGG